MVTTIGRTIIDGLPGDDILEDHNAEAALIGGAGNDRLISRNGRDGLWGGNIFAVTACLDDDDGETDEAGNACADYAPEECGSYDDDDFIASSLCCYCGGGSPGDEVVITTTGTFMG